MNADSRTDTVTDSGASGEIVEMLGLGLKMTLAQLAPIVASLYLAGLVAKQGAVPFSSYTLVTSINVTIFVTISGFLQTLYFVGGRAIGWQDRNAYNAAMTAGLALTVVISIACTLVSVAIGSMLSFLGMDSALVSHATLQGAAAAAGILPGMILLVYRIHAALHGRAGVVTLIYLVGAVSAVGLATVTVVRYGGAPQRVAIGVLMSNAASNWLMLVVAIWTLRAYSNMQMPVSAIQGAAKQVWSKAMEISKVGWPIAAVVLLETLMSLTGSLLVGRYWLSAVPIHAVVMLWVTLCLVVPLGFAQATVQGVAVLHSQGRRRARNRVAIASLLVISAYGVLVTLAFAWRSELLGQVLLGKVAQDVGQQALLRRLLIMGAVAHFFQGIVVIAAAILRGIGQTRAPFVQALIGYGVVAVGAEVLFGVVLGGGVVGVWWGLIIGFAFAAIAVTWRCYRDFHGDGPTAMEAIES